MTKPAPDFWDSGIPYVPLPEATRVAPAEERKARMAATPAPPARERVDPADPHGWRRAFRSVNPVAHRLAAERGAAAEERRRRERPSLGELDRRS